jgi:hypothetical protein
MISGSKCLKITHKIIKFSKPENKFLKNSSWGVISPLNHLRVNLSPHPTPSGRNPDRWFQMPYAIQSRHNLVWPCVIFHQRIQCRFLHLLQSTPRRGSMCLKPQGFRQVLGYRINTLKRGIFLNFMRNLLVFKDSVPKKKFLVETLSP